MNNNKSIESTIDNSIVSDEIKNITSELTEVGLDSLLENGILKDIPVVGTLVSLAKIGESIKEKLFLKKLLYFLFQLKDISSQDRKAFIEKINADAAYKTKVSESVMLLIDKLNDYSKAEFIGKLFAATIRQNINYKTFLKLSNIIDNCYVGDLTNLLPLYNGNTGEVDETDKDILYNLGLLTNLGIDGKTYMWQDGEKIPNKKNQLAINKYGKLIIEILLLPQNSSS